MNPNILNMKVYEYIWKISEYICPKTLSISFYDTSTIQFLAIIYTMVTTIWMEQFVHRSL